jgi:hypothetical protein
MRLAILRAELEAIGVPRKEQTWLLEKFVALPENNSSFSMRQDPVEILTLTTVLTMTLQEALDDYAAKRGAARSEVPVEVPRMQYILVGALTALRSYIDASPEVKARKFEGFLGMVARIYQVVKKAREDEEALDWLRQHGVRYELLEQVSISTQLSSLNVSYDLEQSTPPEEQLLQLVRVLRGQIAESGTEDDSGVSTRRGISKRPSLRR